MTVAAITISPSISEREKLAPKSPTACFSNRLKNQCTDTPLSGKVRPPIGPWKLRMKMADIGP